VGIREVENSRQLKKFFKGFSPSHKALLVQERLYGINASVSLISSGNNVEVLTLNEQLIGLKEARQQEPFGYCGNIVPLKLPEPTAEKCKQIAKKLVLHFGLKGSNGVDFVISRNGVPYVLEVNPRFQGTLECVERKLGINLVEAHVAACVRGKLYNVSRETSGFYTRLVLYAPRRVVTPDLTLFREVRDIPLPNVIVEDGEPLCSVITSGNSRETSLNKAVKLATSIYKTLKDA